MEIEWRGRLERIGLATRARIVPNFSVIFRDFIMSRTIPLKYAKALYSVGVKNNNLEIMAKDLHEVFELYQASESFKVMFKFKPILIAIFKTFYF